MHRWIVLAALSLATAGCSGCDENKAASPAANPSTSTQAESAKPADRGAGAAEGADAGSLILRQNPKQLRIDPRWLQPAPADGATP